MCELFGYSGDTEQGLSHWLPFPPGELRVYRDGNLIARLGGGEPVSPSLPPTPEKGKDTYVSPFP
ncbi:MAG: hypothetical protein Q8O34_00040 [Rhodocyclaceae bacterium]|nr:hypothetical protein [Rhodocyclaceae bacterium]